MTQNKLELGPPCSSYHFDSTLDNTFPEIAGHGKFEEPSDDEDDDESPCLSKLPPYPSLTPVRKDTYQGSWTIVFQHTGQTLTPPPPELPRETKGAGQRRGVGEVGVAGMAAR